MQAWATLSMAHRDHSALVQALKLLVNHAVAKG